MKPTTKAKRTPKKRQAPAKLYLNRFLRFAGRVNWPSITLRTAALVALIVVEIAVATVVGHMASDEVTATLLVVSAGLAGLGVVLGPSVAMSVRPTMQRLAWAVVAGCIAISVWNFSTTLHNAQALSVSNAITGAATYQGDIARLARLNARIDGLSDENNRAAEIALINYTAERDTLQSRLDQANPEPVMFAALPFWLKAGLFHLLVAGFSAGFAIPMRKRKGQRKSAKQAPRGQVGFPTAVNF